MNFCSPPSFRHFLAIHSFLLRSYVPSIEFIIIFIRDIFIMLSLFLLATMASAAYQPLGSRDAIVQMFEWPWDSIAKECTEYLGPAGYGYVQTSTPHEHITGTEWWTDYQVVSYNITSKRGSRDQFKNMVETCKEAKVGILIDLISNHQTGGGSGTGIGGSKWSKYN